MDCQSSPTRPVSICVRARFSLLLACAAILLVPGSAAAGSCAPPGNSGVDQYFETVPGAGCNKSHIPGAPGSGGGGGSLPAGTAQQLANQGPAGQAVAQLVKSTGPGGAGSAGNAGATGGHAKPGAGASHPPIAPAQGSNPLSALLHPLLHGTGSGGTGLLLPLILAAALAAALGAAGWGVMRRRRLNA